VYDWTLKSLSLPTSLTNARGRIAVKKSDDLVIQSFDCLMAHFVRGAGDLIDCAFLVGAVVDFALGGAFIGLSLCLRIAIFQESCFSRMLFYIDRTHAAFSGVMESVHFRMVGGPAMIDNTSMKLERPHAGEKGDQR